jgi:hypothetical protein
VVVKPDLIPYATISVKRFSRTCLAHPLFRRHFRAHEIATGLFTRGRKKRRYGMRLQSATFALLFFSLPALAQRDMVSDYPERKALVLNNCPFIELSDFHFNNAPLASPPRFRQDLRWKNVGTQPIVAFEVVILKYDAFDRRLLGTRWTVTGTNSADWRALAPGASSQDGTLSSGIEEVFTAIAYVRIARLQDGTVWSANDATLRRALQGVAPGIRDFGDVKPDPKTSVK